MEYKDYYEILELEKDASQDDIKRAYRKLARQYHPDINKQADSEAKFKEVGEVYRAAFSKMSQPSISQSFANVARPMQSLLFAWLIKG